jgi:hypothetical protein
MLLIAFAAIRPAWADRVTGPAAANAAAVQAGFKRLSLIENAAWPRLLTSQFPDQLRGR